MPGPTEPAETLDQLGGLLADAERPVYAINGGRVVVYANRAIADWLGLPPTEVVGRGVEYHSAAVEAGGSLLTGMCPSPEALAGDEAVGVISCVERSGGLRRRRARYVPLSGGAVLVIGEPRDLTGEELAELVGGSTPDALHQAIQRFRSERNAAAPAPLLLGRSDATRKLREQFTAASTSGCHALVTGGAAGERRDLAEAIHQATTSGATHRGTPPPLLPIDLTLVGVEEVAEAATPGPHRGPGATLLLLEIDRLNTDQQAALTKTLREEAPPRILATAEDPAAITGDLETLIATMTLRLPRLADRGLDLPLVFQWFIEQQNARGDKQVSGLSDPAAELLAAYPFRDLTQIEQMIAAAHRSCRGPRIDREHLPKAAEQAALAAELAPTSESVDLDQLLADVEREVATRAIATARGNKAEAARLLGLTRPRFYRLLERLGLADEGTNSTADGGADGGADRSKETS